MGSKMPRWGGVRENQIVDIRCKKCGETIEVVSGSRRLSEQMKLHGECEKCSSKMVKLDLSKLLNNKN